MPVQKIKRITLSGFYSKTAPRAVRDTDYRVQARGAAENVFGGFLRANVELLVAATPYPTTLVEYVFPSHDLVLSNPGPAVELLWNRAQIFSYDAGIAVDGSAIDPGAHVPPGEYWMYRAKLVNGAWVVATADERRGVEQRVRLGSAPSPGDRVHALFYIIDYSLA